MPELYAPFLLCYPSLDCAYGGASFLRVGEVALCPWLPTLTNSEGDVAVQRHTQAVFAKSKILTFYPIKRLKPLQWPPYRPICATLRHRTMAVRHNAHRNVCTSLCPCTSATRPRGTSSSRIRVHQLEWYASSI